MKIISNYTLPQVNHYEGLKYRNETKETTSAITTNTQSNDVVSFGNAAKFAKKSFLGVVLSAVTAFMSACSNNPSADKIATQALDTVAQVASKASEKSVGPLVSATADTMNKVANILPKAIEFSDIPIEKFLSVKKNKLFFKMPISDIILKNGTRCKVSKEPQQVHVVRIDDAQNTKVFVTVPLLDSTGRNPLVGPSRYGFDVSISFDATNARNNNKLIAKAMSKKEGAAGRSYEDELRITGIDHDFTENAVIMLNDSMAYVPSGGSSYKLLLVKKDNLQYINTDTTSFRF